VPKNKDRLFATCLTLALLGCSAVASSGFQAPFSNSALPDTTNGIHLAQVFNSNMPGGHYSDEVGKVDYVWGADTEQPPGVYNDFYYPFDRDRDNKVLDSNFKNNLDWFLANHPDWIEYTCNALGKTQQKATGRPYEMSYPPPTDIAFEYYYDAQTGTYGSAPGHYTPLDIENPAVRQFMSDVYFRPAILKGYKGIAFDNVSFENYWNRCGHFDLHGNFVKQYSGNRQIYEPQYTSAIFHWAQWARDTLHKAGAGVTMNFSYDPNVPQESRDLAAYFDIDLSEAGPSDLSDSTVPTWLAYTEYQRYIQSLGKALVQVNYPYTQGYSFKNTTSRIANVQWDLANYLLVKSAHTYFSFFPTGNTFNPARYGDLTWILPEFGASVGIPISGMYQTQNVYSRDYSNGKVFVNPDPSNSYSIGLLSGAYQDLYGTTQGFTVTLPPQSGLVLLRTGLPVGSYQVPLLANWQTLDAQFGFANTTTQYWYLKDGGLSGYHEMNNYWTVPSGYSTASVWTLSFDAVNDSNTGAASRDVIAYVMNNNNQSLAYGALACPINGGTVLPAVSWKAPNSSSLASEVTHLDDGWTHCVLQVRPDSIAGNTLRLLIELVNSANGSAIFQGNNGQSGVMLRNITLRY
jgi:hypothetical protein